MRDREHLVGRGQELVERKTNRLELLMKNGMDRAIGRDLLMHTASRRLRSGGSADVDGILRTGDEHTGDPHENHQC
ncbi:hypothetical protein [Rathayibacter rathayi]|uniref:hypothetical protein n=1 Tax=Rathayibacter rathayi TaxID=33887 RepID=UPI0011B05716|nr:hypothetical protein [Rathayibacter rathayi]